MKKIIYGCVAVLVIAIALFMTFGPAFTFSSYTIDFSSGSPAEDALETFPIPQPYSRVGDIEVVGPEGTMPEIATLRFLVADEDELPEIKSHYQELCQRNDFQFPDERLQSMDPELLCVKQGKRRYSVIFSPSCSDSNCEVQLSVRVI
ncbi:hypothetical protein ACFOZ5_01935 [Marinobacter lacisalsi]|uniref:Uncharacterized protein n=1 Tax=Marinobacter lacisalsi TaxID=475979 RepID=A0ABV8QEB1_9GAMM